MTNADKIRSMSDIELYNLLRSIYDAGAVNAIECTYSGQLKPFRWTLKWLMQEAD